MSTFFRKGPKERPRGTLFRRVSMLAIAFVICVSAFGIASRARAEAPAQEVNPGEGCVVCHATPNLGMQFPNGELVSVQVDPAEFQQSVHGSVLQCTACHTDIQQYPHADHGAIRPSPREVSYLVRSYTSCGECHEEQYKEYLVSSHAQALRNGDTEAAICSDCHGNHDIQPANAEEDGLGLKTAVDSCANCHEQEFDEYQKSVHGKALLEKNDPNVPACVDCHGVHNMGDPTLPGFRRQSPYMCAACHDDAELMKQYGKSKPVMETYVADFHGTTAQLFPISSSQAPEEAMCYDCHGVHEIRNMIDPENPAARQNLIGVCQDCHEDAAQDFPAAWLGHQTPTQERFPLLFWIQRIYTIVIGFCIVGFVGHIALDFGRVVIDKARHGARR